MKNECYVAQEGELGGGGGGGEESPFFSCFRVFGRISLRSAGSSEEPQPMLGQPGFHLGTALGTDPVYKLVPPS